MYFQCLLVFVALSSAAADSVCCLDEEFSIGEGGNGIIEMEGKPQLLSFMCQASVSYKKKMTGADCVEYAPQTNLAFTLVQDYSNPFMCQASVSYKKKMTGADCVEYAPQTNLAFRLVQDYNQGVQYYILKESGKCIKMPLNETQFDRCLPETVKPVANFYFGRPDSPLPATSFEIRKGAFLTVNIDDKKTCTVMGSTIVEQGIVRLETLGYFNLTMGVAPALFDIPASCNKALPLKDGMNIKEHHVKKYYSFL